MSSLRYAHVAALPTMRRCQFLRNSEVVTILKYHCWMLVPVLGLEADYMENVVAISAPVYSTYFRFLPPLLQPSMRRSRLSFRPGLYKIPRKHAQIAAVLSDSAYTRACPSLQFFVFHRVSKKLITERKHVEYQCEQRYARKQKIVYLYIYIKTFRERGMSLKILQFRVTVATYYRGWTWCMNVSYVIGHECVSSVLFQCNVPNLRVLIIYLESTMRSSFVHEDLEGSLRFKTWE
jgi:hypothetical protein